MAWVRIDDQFHDHPKVLEVGPLAEALYIRGLAYAARYLTDGFIPAAHLRRMGDLDALEEARKLVDAGLWDEAENGYQVHDYLDYQPSAEKVKADRKANAERQARFRDKKSGRYSTDSNGSSNAVTNDRPIPTHPDLEVPDGTSTPPIPPQRKRKAAKAKEPTLTPDQLDRFERWYQHWPRKENRAKAEESWAAIDPDDTLVDKMIATTQVYARSEKWREQGGKFIPHPATWLNNARWNDEPPKVEPPMNITPFQANTHRRPPGQRGYSADELLAMSREEANR